MFASFRHGLGDALASPAPGVGGQFHALRGSLLVGLAAELLALALEAVEHALGLCIGDAASSSHQFDSTPRIRRMRAAKSGGGCRPPASGTISVNGRGCTSAAASHSGRACSAIV